MIKLLIFDLDGTLLDTIEDITNAVNYAVKPFGVNPLSVQTIKSMVGSGITRLIEGLIPAQENKYNKTFSEMKEEATSRFLEHYSEHLLDHTLPYPQVTETLSRLTSYKKVILSNKREIFTKQVLEGSGLLKYFDVVLGSDSCSERKPSPVPINEILKRFEIARDEAVIIGDSNFDIEAGKAAGIRTVAVTYGYRPREVLKDADYMIDAFKDLLHMLQEIH
jgi:phosphoglycolate phosphatase